MNPDELLAHDLKSFFMQYMADGKISPSEGLAIASAYVVVNRLINKEGAAHEDTLISVLGHRYSGSTERNDSKSIWIEPENAQTVPIGRESRSLISTEDTMRL